MKNCPTMPDLDRQDYVILNSTVNVPKAIDVLSPYERIHCMLDNDETGYKATRAMNWNTPTVCVTSHTITGDIRT